MPTPSERQIALRLLGDLIPTLRSQALTSGLRYRLQKRLIWLFYFDELLEGDPMVVQMYRLCQNEHAKRGTLLQGMEALSERIETHRYFLDRGSWRGLRHNRLSYLDWLLEEMDEVWFVSQVRLNRAVFNFVLSQIEDDPIFYNQAYYKQYQPKYQLMVALYRFGHYGNGASVKEAAKIFKIAEGTVVLWTGRVIIAILAQQSRWIRWPTAEEKGVIKTRIGQQSAFGHCVGFADGSLLPLETKPAREDYYDYWSRKYRYGLNALIVCDDENRITYMKLGWGASAHDISVYRDTGLFHRGAEFFSEDEYVLADSGYLGLHDEKVITSYKENAAGRINRDDRKRFNKEIAKVRIEVEHTIGMLKSRWQSLRGLRQLVRSQTTFTNLLYWIRACVTIHNMLLGFPDDDWWEGEDMEEMERSWAREAARSSEVQAEEDIRQIAQRTSVRQERLRLSFERNGYARAYEDASGGV